ncbi:hypothetical protein BME96_15990 [Virgibacillus halodenitrificans]|uniref:Homing endonuclease LAGLIDADG domain-containing protein n=1 Tax=Virgibacillus halodenitrificans TaxID=1482 RepID=A0AAC9NLZ4_VIRHA|nr:hypothetical protein [Virgibacillus halodenitrificans]APC49600.1 hypothetical protein BME96_15990 [Virgibacillus halodenitrificans]
MCKVNTYLSRLTGKLLGDGCITKQQGRKPRFQFIHRKEDLQWSNYCYESLRNFIPLNPPKYKKTIDPRLKMGMSESYIVQSKTSTAITSLERSWYVNRKKRLPFDFITCYLDAEALAWWYQDDGHLKKCQNMPRKIILSTDSFSKEENAFLQHILQVKFNLSFKIDRQNRLILYDQVQMNYFLRLVGPYMQPCMKRKTLDGNSPSEEPIFPRRTTVYLPEHILLVKPTQEINHSLRYTNKIISQLESRDSYLQFYQANIKHLKQLKELRGYQIVISGENGRNLQLIKQLIGWNQSQVAYWCFENG